MPDKPGKKEKQAQQARSQRYGISVRDDGNVTKPSKWENVADSQWGDPVNYLYPVPDKTHASNAKSRFTQNKDEYETRSRSVVLRRLNRLLRKYKIEPMKSDEEQDDEMGFNGLLIGRIQLEDEEDDESGVIIPAARVATFDHPWWGKMYLDQDLYESFIDNWQSDVVGTQLAIDAEHRRNGMLGGMALAWIDGLELNPDDDIFYIHAQPTDVGRQYLGDVYRYASIEYTDNYRDQETGIEYGPTLFACAATNHPFVHRNPPMTVQNDNPAFAFGNVEQTGGGVYYYVWPETWLGSSDETDKTVESAGDEHVADVEIFSEESTMPDNVPVAAAQPNPEPTPVAASQTPQAARVEFLELPDGTRISAEEVARMRRDTAALKANLKASKVNEITKAALDRGVPPVVVNVVRAYLEQLDMDADTQVTLDDQTFNDFFAVAHILDVVPGRLGEVTYTDPGQQPAKDVPRNVYVDGKEDMTLEEAEALARKRRSELGDGGAVEIEI